MKRIVLAATLAALAVSPAVAGNTGGFCSPGMIIAGIGPTNPVDGVVVYANGLTIQKIVKVNRVTVGAAIELGKQPVPVRLVDVNETAASWSIVSCS